MQCAGLAQPELSVAGQMVSPELLVRFRSTA